MRDVRLTASLWFVAVAWLLVGHVAPAAAEEPTATEIVETALQKHTFSFESGKATLKLEIRTDAGERSTREMAVRSKEIDDRVRTLVELTAPPDLEGQSFLFAENPGGEDDLWMYVPAFSVTRRIEGSKKNGAFLGSHFTYSDLESRDVEQASYSKTGSSSIGGDPVYEVTATPDQGADSDYAKVVVFVRKKDLAPLKFRFYEGDDELEKTLFVRELGETDSGSTYVEKMRMSAEGGGHTEMTVASLEPDAEFSDSLFSKGQLGK